VVAHLRSLCFSAFLCWGLFDRGSAKNMGPCRFINYKRWYFYIGSFLPGGGGGGLWVVLLEHGFTLVGYVGISWIIIAASIPSFVLVAFLFFILPVPNGYAHVAILKVFCALMISFIIGFSACESYYKNIGIDIRVLFLLITLFP